MQNGDKCHEILTVCDRPIEKMSDASLPSVSCISNKKHINLFTDVKYAFVSKINDVWRLLISKFVILMTIHTQ